MTLQMVKTEALREVAILAVRLAIALDEDLCQDRGWRNVSFRPAWKPGCTSQLGKRIIVGASSVRMNSAPLSSIPLAGIGER